MYRSTPSVSPAAPHDAPRSARSIAPGEVVALERVLGGPVVMTDRARGLTASLEVPGDRERVGLAHPFEPRPGEPVAEHRILLGDTTA